MPSRRTVLRAVPLTAAALALSPALPAAATPVGGAPVGGQSPIALSVRDARRDRGLPELVVDYPDSVDVRVRYVSRDAGDPAGCTTRGREETVEAEVPAGAAGLRLGDRRYELLQFHFHTPSEHVLDGRRFPVEQHWVHRGDDGSTLVLGLLLAAGGRRGTAQDRVLERLPEECGEEVEVPGLDLAGALPRDLDTLRYSGSLTTSPFTEPVSWLVLTRPGSVRPGTAARLREAFPDGNARDLQPLGGRTVVLRRQ